MQSYFDQLDWNLYKDIIIIVIVVITTTITTATTTTTTWRGIWSPIANTV